MQLNATHFMLTFPGGAAITEDPALHRWNVYEQKQEPATGFGMYNGNNNAVWLTNSGATVEMAVSGAVGAEGDRRTNPILLRYAQDVSTVQNGSSWAYKGPIWVGKGLRVGRSECGDYFSLSGHKVAMYSWGGRQVAWMVGQEMTSNGTFVASSSGVVDYGGYYASASFQVSDGRRILWAWVLESRGPPYGGSIWAGVQALPREVTVTDSGGLSFSPARELEQWRDGAKPMLWKGVRVNNQTGPVELRELETSGLAFEIDLNISLASSGTVNRTGLLVRVGRNSTEQTFIGLDQHPSSLVVDRRKSSTARVARNPVFVPTGGVAWGQPLQIRIFVDHSVLTVFVAGKVLTTRVYPDASSTGVQLTSSSGAEFDVRAWGFKRAA